MTPPTKGEGEKEKLAGINGVVEGGNGEREDCELGEGGEVASEKAERSTREEETGIGGDLKPASGESQVHNDDGQLARSGNGQSRYTDTHTRTLIYTLTHPLTHAHTHTQLIYTVTHLLTRTDKFITRGLNS